MSDIDFCDKLEDLIYNYNYNDPMVIMGDLNIDLYDITINKNFKSNNENQ
jgi:exonuclease III